MSAASRSLTAAGVATVVLDRFQTPFNVSYAVELIGGPTAAYAVQFTLDDVNDTSITAVWFDDANNPTGTAASAVGNYAFPVRAIRANAATLTGGSLRFKVMQGGS